jgi:hypothetical protein
MRIFWSTIGSIIAFIFALILFHQFRPLHVDHDQQPTLDFTSREQIMEAQIPDIAKEAIIGLSISSSGPDPALTSVAPSSDDGDSRLRIFDEL